MIGISILLRTKVNEMSDRAYVCPECEIRTPYIESPVISCVNCGHSWEPQGLILMAAPVCGAFSGGCTIWFDERTGNFKEAQDRGMCYLPGNHAGSHKMEKLIR